MTYINTNQSFKTQNQKFKQAWLEFINQHYMTSAITLVWNKNTSEAERWDDLKRLTMLVDQNFLGSRSAKKPASIRTEALFVAEGLGYHDHVHSVWRFPNNEWFRGQRLLASNPHSLWNDVVKSGSVYIDSISPEVKADELIGYIMKGQHRNSDCSEMVWASDFHPKK